MVPKIVYSIFQRSGQKAFDVDGCLRSIAVVVTKGSGEGKGQELVITGYTPSAASVPASGEKGQTEKKETSDQIANH